MLLTVKGSNDLPIIDIAWSKHKRDLRFATFTES